MKNLAKLVLFFSLSFVFLFFAAVLLNYLSSWINFARIIPPEPQSGKAVSEAVWQAFPPALYLSVLLALSYTARRKISIPLTVICLLALGFAFSAGVSLGINRTEAVKTVITPVSPPPAGPGLVLSRGDNAVVLLDASGVVRGSRVVSLPGRPLVYQETPLGPNNTVLPLPALPFGGSVPWFIRSLGIDFSLSAGQFDGRLKDSFFSFAVYAFSLVLLLVSLRFLFELSQWPLANMFLGVLAFRGILALETFLNAREINALIGSFLSEDAPPALVTPLVFCALAVLVLFYTLITRIARPRRNEDE